MTFDEWLVSGGVGLLGDIIIPVGAIVVSTWIAVKVARQSREDAAKLARQEREDAAEADRRSRKLDAGGEVLVILAAFISVDALQTDMQVRLGELRGRIAVYSAWVAAEDLSADWLKLQHSEGMRLWALALSDPRLRGQRELSVDEMFDIFDAPRTWARDLIDTFSGWLSGHVPDNILRSQGAQILAQRAEGRVENGLA